MTSSATATLRPVNIRPIGRCLDHQTTVNLSPSQGVVRGRPVIVDLRNVQFIEPFGIVYLYWLIEYLLQERASKVTINVSLALQNYLVRMDLPKAFEANNQVEFRPNLHLLHLFRRNLSNRLVELKTFQLRDDDEVEQLAEQMMEVIHDRRPDLKHLHYQLYLAFSELLSNIEVHSWTRRGALVVQSYGSNVYMAMGDGGVGIPHRLAKQCPGMSDAAMIEHALQPQVSTRIGRGGMGLTVLSETVREHGTYMAIRSGCGHVIIGRDGNTRRDDCASLPGTLVEVVW